MPEIEGGRYEIIDGELFGTTVPHASHQRVMTIFVQEFYLWDRNHDLGLCVSAPGVILAKNQAVAPDLIWVRKDRLEQILGNDGHFHAAPDLIIEVASPGQVNSGRDRELKLDMYERYAVPEYWIADWQAQTIEIYEHQGAELGLARVLDTKDTLSSQLLPGFSCPVERIFTI